MSSGWDLDLTLLDPHFLLDRDLRGRSYGQVCRAALIQPLLDPKAVHSCPTAPP